MLLIRTPHPVCVCVWGAWLRHVGGVCVCCVCVRCAWRHVGVMFEMHAGINEAHMRHA